MYFPYLRGKQFELIALRETSGLMRQNKGKISPIIEPVKKLSTTLKKTLHELISKDVNFTLIANPRVGGLENPVETVLDFLSTEFEEINNYQIGIILDNHSSPENIVPVLKKYPNLNPKGITLIHNSVHPNITDIIDDIENVFPVVNNVINFNSTKSNRRYYRNFDTDTRVSLDDYFSSEQKNADYHGKQSDFTEEHLYYKDDGYKGFSDFLTIGDNYSDSGFMPYAVAIHISYITGNKKIGVQHFVSDSNGDTSDVAGKFEEANRKLVDWCVRNNHSTTAIKEFVNLQENEHFPGLGTIKKLSVENHIEVVLKLI